MTVRSFVVRSVLSSAFLASAALSISTNPAAFAADPTFNGETISTLGDASQLSLTNSRISGTGSIVFSTKLSDIGDDTSHALSFTLKDGGSLTFVANADPSLGQGVEFVFSREGNVLKGNVRKGGDSSTVVDFSTELSNINAARVLNLQIDVHNSESPAHILVWDGLESSFTEDNALLNTEELDAAPGNGLGQRRGFVLKNATLLKAVASEEKFEHGG